jgi:hypothetical protein
VETEKLLDFIVELFELIFVGMSSILSKFAAYF